MQHFKTIAEYCKEINISLPNQSFFDIRNFEKNMQTVVSKTDTFSHEFYAIAIKVEGTGKAISGHYTDFPEGATIFFNTPFQLLSWDISPDWKGYYLMFSKEFISKSKYLKKFLTEFPFLKIDKAIPFKIKPKDVSVLLTEFEFIYQENKQLRKDTATIIEAHLLVLLNYIKRFFQQEVSNEDAQKAICKADVVLLSRFQTLIETSFYETSPMEKRSHSPKFYAERLAVHPNHLNAVVKQITGNTAKKIISNHLLRLAKSRLLQTHMSIKEIAYNLNFETPNNFSTFFKKQTRETPNNFRKNH